MSDVAALIADMVRAGVEPELIGRAAQAIADASKQDIVAVRSSGALRQERYRRNKASQVTDGDAPSPEKVSPTPPSKTNPNPTPPSPPKGGSSPTATGFEEFWLAYPHKVGKRDAEQAWRKAVKRADAGQIMAGLRTYVAKTDDRPWCNPSTWLNQDRWGDEPARAPPGLDSDWRKSEAWAGVEI